MKIVLIIFLLLFNSAHLWASGTPQAGNASSSTPSAGSTPTPSADVTAGVASNASGGTITNTVDQNLPNLQFLWKCRRDPSMDKGKCTDYMFHFCTNRCSRLTCAILTNRSICLDVCGRTLPIMEACVMAGKRKPVILVKLPQPPMDPGAGMNPNSAMAGMAAAGLASAAAKGIGSLFKK